MRPNARVHRAYHQVRFESPRGATELFLVRHGESEAAVEDQLFDLVEGQGDPPLSSEGKREADLVCRRLTGEHVDAIYATPLRRTVQTAQPLSRRLRLTPVIEPDLREVFLGEWEGGLYRRKMFERDPTAVRMLTEQRWDVIPGAESATSLARRVRAAIERIRAAHPSQRVAVFTHAGTIGEVLAQATGSEPFAFVDADNASISQLVITPERWILRGFNDTAHLRGAVRVGGAHVRRAAGA